jgi:hypothetical protein
MRRPETTFGSASRRPMRAAVTDREKLLRSMRRAAAPCPIERAVLAQRRIEAGFFVPRALARCLARHAPMPALPNETLKLPKDRY